MKSLIRLRRIALQHGLSRPSPLIRSASSSSSLYPNNPLTLLPTANLLSETPAFASSSSSHNPGGPPLSLSDRSLRQLPRHISSDASASAETHGFFTPSPRPSSSFAPTALLSSLPASEARINGDEAIKRLRDIVQQPKASRTDSIAKQNWHFYRSLPLTTRRSLPADVLQRMLRAVVPAEQGLPSISAVRSLSPGTHGEFNRAFKQKWQRRLQTVMSDMIHSSSTVEAHGATMELPTLKDFSFVLGRLGRVGMWRHCEAISREMEARGMAMDEQVMAKRVWAMARALEIPRSRYSPKPDGKPIADALWGVLAQIEKSDIQTSHLLVNNIIITVGLLQRHFSSEQRRSESLGNDTFKARLDDLMDEVLTKMCGVDLQYFTLALPSASASNTSGVGRSQLSSHALRAVLYHALRTGGVYRMLSAFETLVERSPQQEQADGEARHGGAVVDQEDDMESWPTLSEMEAMEREERQSRGIFGRVKAQEVIRDESTLGPSTTAAAGGIDLVTGPNTTVAETVGDDTGAAEVRTFNHFIPPLQSPLAATTPPSPLPASVLQDNVHALPETYRILEKGAIQSLILAACDARNLPLALHILRSAMRITAEVRHAWLGRLLARANQDLSDAPPALTSAGPLTPSRDPSPRLGLEAEWFARVHTLTNKVWPHGRTADKNVLLPRFWSILEDAARQIKDERDILQLPLAQRALTSNPSSIPTNDVSAPDAIAGIEIDIDIESAADSTAEDKIPCLANVFDLSSTAASLDSTLASIEQIRWTSIARRQREVLNKQRRTAAWRMRHGEKPQTIAADKAASALGVVDRRGARRRTVKVEQMEEATRLAMMRKSKLIEDGRTSLWCAKREVDPICMDG